MRRRRRLTLTRGSCITGLLYKTPSDALGRSLEILHPSLPRSLFPALASNDFAFLNSGGSGPPPAYVTKAMRATDDLCSGPAYLEGPAFYERQSGANDRARESAAHLLGCSPDDLALTQSTTHGMNLGAFSMDWREGDEAISTTTEHPGCLVPLHALARRFGVKVKLVEPPITAGKVADEMTGRTRLVALSHVDWTDGTVLPLAEISALARERGALTLVDGAQSVGNIPVDLPATGVDMYAFTGHKWLLGPEGMGGLYVRPDCEARSPNVGFASLEDPADFDIHGGYELREDARRFESSTISPALAGGFAAAAESASERGEAGFDSIRHRAQYLTDLLSELPNVTLHSSKRARCGLVSFEVERMAPKEVAELLLEKRFVLRYIPEPNPYVRASTHLFNTEEELEALARSVGELRL
jgi:L-cysteine/cystine lyase